VNRAEPRPPAIPHGLRRSLRTATFRLALLYAVIFGLSALTLFAFLHWRLTGYMTDQIRSAIAAEMSFLAKESSLEGTRDLIPIVDTRANAADSASSYYLLQNPKGERLAGNVAPLPPVEGEFRRPAEPLNSGRPNRDPAEQALFQGHVLEDGSYIAIGRDLNDVQDLGRVINRAIATAVGLTAILAAVGGLLLGVSFLHRIEVINQTTARIIAGNLSQRVPLVGVDDELDRLAGNLNRMLDRIESLMETTRQVSNDIAHDLRTPLARLRQRLERVQARASTAAHYETEVSEAIIEIDGILGTFSALLRIAQVEAGARAGGFAEVNVSRVFETIAEAYAPVAEDAGQVLTCQVTPGVAVQGDRELLTQMLANLVENAIRHTPAGSAIEVILRTGPNGLVGEVRDSGPGIPASEHGKVFRRFYRLERNRTSAGNGLGLSLVAAVAELHGIRIELGDNGPGLVVRMLFPASRVAMTAAGRPGAVVPAPPLTHA
jgi:signal transduction histidine kinase